MSNPYTPSSKPSSSTQVEPGQRFEVRRYAAIFIAVSSFAILLIAAWLTAFDPVPVIVLVMLWLCVFVPMSVSILWWGVRGFLVTLLLSPFVGFAALLLAIRIAISLGLEVMPGPN